MQGRGLNQQTIIIAAIVFVVLAALVIVLGSGGNLFGTAADTPTPVADAPTDVPPTDVPPTEAPPTDVPPTEAPPTEVPPTEVPPTEVPPTEVPPTEVPPTEAATQAATEALALVVTETPTEAPPSETPTEEPPSVTPEPPTATAEPPSATPEPATEIPTQAATQAATQEARQFAALQATTENPVISISGQCFVPDANSVTFTITNAGQADMFAPGTMTLYQLGAPIGSQSIQLAAGASIQVTLSAVGNSGVVVTYQTFNVAGGTDDSQAQGFQTCIEPGVTTTPTFTPAQSLTPSQTLTPSETFTPGGPPPSLGLNANCFLTTTGGTRAIITITNSGGATNGEVLVEVLRPDGGAEITRSLFFNAGQSHTLVANNQSGLLRIVVDGQELGTVTCPDFPTPTATVTSPPNPIIVPDISCNPADLNRSLFTLRNLGGDMLNAGQYFISEVGQPDEGPFSFQLASGEAVGPLDLGGNARIFGDFTSVSGRSITFAYQAACQPRPPDTATPTPSPTLTPTTPNYQLNLANIACVNNEVEIRFVLLNVPAGVTPGTLTYTYGTITPVQQGSEWHYVDTQPDGTYDVTTATVDVGGVTVTLSNPSQYAGDYRCTPTLTPTTTAPPQSSLDVTGECTEPDTATWRITNTGGAMSSPDTYTVNGPSGVVRTESFQLGAGESLVVTVTGVQGTLTLEIPTQNVSVDATCVEPQVSVAARGVCSENLVATFTVTNNGSADMPGPSPYRVERADGTILTSGVVQLQAGESVQIPVAGVGGGLRLIVDGLGVTVDTTCAEPQTPTPPARTQTATPVIDCATWSLDEDGFPVFDYTMDGGEACRDAGLPPEPWTALTPGAGSCPIWAVYHTNHTGTWEIFRLGELPDDPSAPANLSQGYEPNIFSIKPSRSPDNEWIAYSTNRSGAWDIWVAPTDGRSLPQRVTYNQFAITSDPVWSPGGRYIAYESSRDGNWEIYMFDVTTGQETRLTENDATDTNAFWRPLQPGESESTRLVFQTLRDGLWQIYELDLATLDVTRLSDGQGPDRNPQYSNDAQQIVFVTDRMGSNPVVALMDADPDTAEITTITDPAGPSYNTSWSPDDRLIAYQSLQPDNEQWAVYVYELETELTRQLTSTDLQPDERRDASIAPTWYCGTTDVLWASDALWDTDDPRNVELYTVNALPIDGEPIDVRTELSPLTRNPGFINYDPQNAPSEEDASNRP